jgi:peroxidase
MTVKFKMVYVGIDSNRPASDGGELLNPRNISLGIIGDDGPNSTDVTLAMVAFGQFITHDITFSEEFSFGMLNYYI